MHRAESSITANRTVVCQRNDDSAALRPVTILLVDDDHALRSLAGSYLSRKGFRVVSCSDAELAGEVVKSRTRIDLLITDVDMPVRSGTDLSIEMNDLRPAVPVLLISGGCQTEQVQEQARQRGWDRLAKPFRLPELLKSVHVLLERPPQA